MFNTFREKVKFEVVYQVTESMEHLRVDLHVRLMTNEGLAMRIILHFASDTIFCTGQRAVLESGRLFPALEMDHDFIPSVPVVPYLEFLPSLRRLDAPKIRMILRQRTWKLLGVPSFVVAAGKFVEFSELIIVEWTPADTNPSSSCVRWE